MSINRIAYTNQRLSSDLVVSVRYSAVCHKFKYLIKTSASAAVLGLALSSCALSTGSNSLATDTEIVTNSVTQTVEVEGIDPTDAETIKSTVVFAGSESDKSHLLSWTNPETGNKGTISAIDQFVGNHGQSCKKFRTTVDSFMGISLYNGETCELRKGFWVLSWFIREQNA